MFQMFDSNGSLQTSGGGSSYTDTMARDAVGGILLNTDSIEFTYDDITPSISAIVSPTWEGQNTITTLGTITTGTLGLGTKILVGSDATGDIYYNGGSGAITRLPIGTAGYVLTSTAGVPAWVANPLGTVTSVSVVTANGISGSVATATTTPAITLTLGAITPTTVNGLYLSLGFSSISTNIAIGLDALSVNTTGSNNVGIGYTAMQYNLTGIANTAVGSQSLLNNETTNSNTAIGFASLRNTGAARNTALGNESGRSNNAGSGSVYIGNQAGYFETASNKLFIDNTARTNEADGRVKALIYGVFDTLTANQRVTINGLLTVTEGIIGDLTGSTTTTAITDDTTTNATMYPTWVTAVTGNLPQKVSSTKLSFNPSTGSLSSTNFIGTFAGNTITTGTGTLTLAASSSLITSGAFALTLTSSATSNVTIPSGTNTLYSTLAASITSAQLLASLTNPTGTGVAVFGTTPTITTSMFVPLVIGGTTTTSPLTFRTTSGVGTTGADFIWQSGSNGATEVMRLLNNKTLLIGTATALGLENMAITNTVNGYVGIRLQGTSTYAGTDWTIFASSSTASSVNDFIGFFNNSTADGATAEYKFKVHKNGNVAIGNISVPTASLEILQQALTAGIQRSLVVTSSSQTGQTASTEKINIYFNNSSTQWAAGNITTQRECVVVAPSYSFIGNASTITDAVTWEVTGAPTISGGSSAITRPWAARLLGAVAIGTKMYIGSATGVVAPTALLHLAAGTATANTGPIQLTTGTRETVARAGLLEFENNHYQTTVSLVRYGLGGAIFDYNTDVANGTTVETDLYSTTLIASTLAVNNDKIEAVYGGVFVSSGTATRQIKIYFGGTAIFDTGALTLSLSSAWAVNVEIIRVSSTVVRYVVELTTQGAALSAYTSCGEVTGLTLSNTNILKITGTAAGVGANSGDITAKMGFVKFLAAA